MILPVEFAKQLTIRGIPVLASLVADDRNGAEPKVEKFSALVARLCTKDAVRDVAVESLRLNYHLPTKIAGRQWHSVPGWLVDLVILGLHW